MTSASDRELLMARYTTMVAPYQRLWAPVLEPHALALVEALPIEQAKAILDLGTGTGTLLPHLRAAAPEAFIAGGDLTEAMVRLAAEREVAPVLRLDAAALPLRDGSVDVVVSAFMLFHVPEPIDALREAHRVLRPGGATAFAVWGADRSAPAVEVVIDELDRAGAADPLAGVIARSDEQLDDPDKLGGLLELAGFADVRSWTRQLGLSWPPAEAVEFGLTFGEGGRRASSLDPETVAEVRERASRRVASLPPEAFVEDSTVVSATARRP